MAFKTVLRHAALATVLAFPFAVGMGSGCGRAQEVCDVVCDCVLCNDRTEDDCIIELDRMIERAEAYDCVQEADDYFDCAINKGDCDDNVFDANDCIEDELADVLDCIEDNSDIIGD